MVLFKKILPIILLVIPSGYTFVFGPYQHTKDYCEAIPDWDYVIFSFPRPERIRPHHLLFVSMLSLNMIDRSDRISVIFSKPIPFSTNTYLFLTLITISLIANMEYSSKLPFWVRDLDYLEILLLALMLIFTSFTYISREQYRKQENIGFELGFERGEPFNISIDNKEVFKENTWKLGDSRSFSLDFEKPNTLKMHYNGKIDDSKKRFLLTENAVTHLTIGSEITVLDIPGESMIDDIVNILEVLQKV